MKKKIFEKERKEQKNYTYINNDTKKVIHVILSLKHPKTPPSYPSTKEKKSSLKYFFRENILQCLSGFFHSFLVHFIMPQEENQKEINWI